MDDVFKAYKKERKIGPSILKESLIKSHNFWQRQVSKFETLILSIVILWFKSITKKLGTWLIPARTGLQGINSVVMIFAKGTTILKNHA